MLERTIVFIKPKDNQRSIATSILQIFKNNGLSIENVDLETDQHFSDTITTPFYKVSIVGEQAIVKAAEIIKNLIAPNFSNSLIHFSNSPTASKDELNKFFKTNLKNQTFNDLIKNPVNGENYQIKIKISQIDFDKAFQVFETIENQLISIQNLKIKNYGLNRKSIPNEKKYIAQLLFEFTLENAPLKINEIKEQVEKQLKKFTKKYSINVFEQLIKRPIVERQNSLINYDNPLSFGSRIPTWEKKH